MNVRNGDVRYNFFVHNCSRRKLTRLHIIFLKELPRVIHWWVLNASTSPEGLVLARKLGYAGLLCQIAVGFRNVALVLL